MKGSIEFEVRENFYVLDFENLPNLEEKYHDYLKEENFEDLNDYYYYNILNRKETTLKEWLVLSSKLSQKSSFKDSWEFKDIEAMELAFLDHPKQLYSKERKRSRSMDEIREDAILLKTENNVKSVDNNYEEENNSLQNSQSNFLVRIL